MDDQKQYSNEAEKKMAAERQDHAVHCVNARPQSFAAAIAGAVRASDSTTESLRTRCNRRAMDASGEMMKYSRAADILNRHPEFEEFLELLRLIPESDVRR